MKNRLGFCTVMKSSSDSVSSFGFVLEQKRPGASCVGAFEFAMNGVSRTVNVGMALLWRYNGRPRIMESINF